MASNQLKTQSLTITILAVVCLLAGYLLTYQTYAKMSVTKTALTKATEEEKKLSLAYDELASFLDKYKAMSEKATVAGQALPLAPDLAVLLGSIDEMAKISGVDLASISIIDSKEINDNPNPHSLAVAQFSVDASASYPAFKDFLLRLEKNLRLIDIQRITFKVDEANFLQLQMTVKTYYQKE
ncbi:MAG TPA: type 4a pilus biogenesis protein PilO [Patescibacteria group bacterium]|jgi:hypothetical protein|nr:type 4a pilus biogenesis protein PilO [Patescibacteria group bacterium]